MKPLKCFRTVRLAGQWNDSTSHMNFMHGRLSDALLLSEVAVNVDSTNRVFEGIKHPEEGNDGGEFSSVDSTAVTFTLEPMRLRAILATASLRSRGTSSQPGRTEHGDVRRV